MTAQWVHLAASIAPPRFDAAALHAYLHGVGDPTPLIRQGLDMIQSAEWAGGADGLTDLFGLDRRHHCFHVAPHAWATFHEPQITAGFVHFLTAGDRPRRLSRAISLAQAAAHCAGKTLDVRGIVSARCAAEENRTDILVELHGGPRPIGASIEAKFGHQLTTGQLPKAYAHASAQGWDLEKSAFLVVTSDPADLTLAIMRQNRPRGWRATAWWALLSELERLTDPAHDCADYRRFRRTVWHRAY
jgi:hypothetical protein